MGREATNTDVDRHTSVVQGGSKITSRKPVQNRLRVQRVRAKRFRGISGEMVMDFRTPEGKAVSAIIAGDNGTGKSSVVDALEFALQGRFTGSSTLQGEGPFAVSYGGEGKPSVEVLLTDGSSFSREIARNDKGKWSADRTPHPSFSTAPFVLRRRDILQFWDTPAERRQIALLAYFKGERQAQWPEELEERIRTLEKQRHEAKQDRRRFREKLAGLFGVPAESIPHGMNDFDDYVRDKIYGGKTSKERKRAKRRGRPVVKANPQLDGLARKIRETSRRVSQAERALREAKETVPSTGPTQRITESMLRIGQTITDSFREVSSGGSHVQRIEVHPGRLTSASLEVVVCLHGGQEVDPRKVFSEANLDLLALLIFLAVAKESAERGQAKLLVLDDVLQSVDAAFRIRAAEYILEEFSDWQLIYTVHDRLWQEQLKDLLRRRNVSFVDREIVRWTFESGPKVISDSLGMEELLQEAMHRGDLYGTCAHAGLLLERTCNVLSYNLPISVTRRRGDKYTLGDLWPGIYKTLKKTTVAPVSAEVDRWLHLRNLLGAHYNEWAQALSKDESWQFGEAVLKLLETMQCSSCHRWVEVDALGGSGTSWSCRCSSTTITKVPQS